MRERTQRFRRRMRGQNKAVSPVVATLILILIAVAAAAALYLWLVAWQGNITGGIGNQQVQATFTIGGSTSVYPFSSLGVSWYEQNHSDVVIQDDQGGTGAGMLAVCAGHIDVGAASSLETVTGLQSSDGCPSTPGITITTIAYDAVDVIVQSANPHGLQSISYDTLAYVYETQTTTGTPTLVPNSINEAAIPSGLTAAAGKLAWDQIPASVEAVTFQLSVGSPVTAVYNYTENLSHGVAAYTTLDQPAAADVPTALANDGICGGTDAVTVVGTVTYNVWVCNAAASGDTPCGWSICAGGTAAIDTVARSDASGTTQTFEARLLGAGSSSGGTSPTQFVGTTSSAAATAAFSSLGFGGCGNNNLISDCGYAATKTAVGNPGVIAAVAGDANAIGYASDGLARATGSGVTCEGVATAACGIGLQAPSQSAAVQPALGASGSIAGGIVNGGFGTPGLTTTLNTAHSYAGARPFEFVTLQPPAGEVEDFFSFLTAPDVNQNLAAATGEVSLYSI